MRYLESLRGVMPTLTLVFLTFLTAPAFAQVNHGDFLGASVDFLDVTETTQSPGDPAVLWDAPSLAGTGDQLLFLPPGFSSACTAGGSDVTSSLLTMDIAAQPGGHIDTLTLVESGDTVLGVFPPYGTAATNTSVTMSGTLTVTETTAGPIAPVVIPWSGTFLPTGNFELPGDFGTNTWDGRVDIDVASVVANATTATLAWDNTLAANCGAGSTNALIQKKVVNGPVVAIMVNPLECDLQLDKTCCVPQPVLPDLDICEGDVVRMLLEYTGDKCSASTNEQGKKFRCYGRRELGEPATIEVLDHWGASPVVATPSSGVLIGDTVELTSTTGTFPDRTKLKVSDDWSRRQYLKIDTSCDRSIRCDDQFGAFRVVGLESTLGGFVDCTAPPPPPTCDAPGDPAGTPCDAKVVDMVLEYTGRICQNPLPNPQNGEASCTGDTTGAIDVGIVYTGKFGYKQIVSPASNVNDGDRIRVTSTWQGGLFPNQEYIITDASGVRQEVAFHTSCSQPFALGDEFGPFTVVEMTTKNGTQLALGDGSDGTADACEVPLAPPTPHCTSDLEAVTLVYIGDFLGQGCTVSNSQGGYASCAGVADPGELVAVTPGSGLMADPMDGIEFGDLVTFTNTTAGQELPGLTTLDVTGSGGTQSISIKTSCEKPLSLGDRFGSFVVFAMDREDDGPISLGGEILYQYNVTNPNAVAVDNVVVDDSELGEIASGVSIPAGETVTFSRAATLYGTTTNVATANGDVNGDVCDPGSDSVTVDVKVPPQGSFTCSCNTSMTELTVIWDQVGTVDVKVWDGPIGSTLLTQFFGLQKGDQITVGPFTAEDSVWEITDSVSGFPIGKSIFKLTCWDQQMNGVEDCGKRQGNGKYDDPAYLNKWILEGMADDDESLVCTPTVVVPPGACGLGPELLVVLPGLLWLHRRRQRQA